MRILAPYATIYPHSIRLSAEADEVGVDAAASCAVLDADACGESGAGGTGGMIRWWCSYLGC